MNALQMRPDRVYLTWDSDDNRDYIRRRFDEVYHPGAFEELDGMSVYEAYEMITGAMLAHAKLDNAGTAMALHELLSSIPVYRFPDAEFDTETYAQPKPRDFEAIYQSVKARSKKLKGE